MRLIDADALQKEYQKEHGKRLLLIDVAPTIDAVEVVRCKDCKFGVYEKGRGIYHIRCEILEFLFQDDDYCSYGERREE